MPVQELFMSLASLKAGVEVKQVQILEEQKRMLWFTLAQAIGIDR